MDLQIDWQNRLDHHIYLKNVELINTALSRYLFLVSKAPDFSQAEWDLMRDACNGWATTNEQPQTLAEGLLQKVHCSIFYGQLAAKWNVNAADLLARLDCLKPVEAIAIIHAIEKFWLQNSDKQSN